MRGLPPIPDDVVSFETTFYVDGAFASVTFWVLMPGVQTAALPDLELVRGDLMFGALDLFTRLMANAGELSTCRVRVYGSAPVTLFTGYATNHGVNGGCLTLNAATPISFGTSERGRPGTVTYFVPACPDNFTDNHVSLNQIGANNAGLAASNWISYVNAINRGTITSCTLGTVHRSRNGAPLPASVFAPYFYGFSTNTLGTIRRRMHQGRSRPPFT